MIKRIKDPIGLYVSSFPPVTHKALAKLRAAIRAASPTASECVRWQMPCYQYKGRLIVSFAGFQDHCSFSAMTPLVEMSKIDFTGYDTTVCAIRFSPLNPLPTALVRKIVKARMVAVDSGGKIRPLSPFPFPSPLRRGITQAGVSSSFSAKRNL